MRLSDEQKKAYIDAGGVCCPECDSSDVEGRCVEVDAGRATQQMSCLSCAGQWTDVYALVDLIPTE